jgi:threonylcarbamoyladenosine tRNA methylthiotransferase MtaB
MTFITATLGCKVNQYETQALEHLLIQKGCRQNADNPDVVIVNTCAVTAESERKCRQMIRHLRRKYPEAILAVCGCYSQLGAAPIQEIGADLIFGSGNKEEFVDAILAAGCGTDTSMECIDNPFERYKFEPLPSGNYEGRTRALLKIQDGCANFCTYCIIPYTRGRPRSLPPEQAVQQAVNLARQGYRELVLTGIEIASYGTDLPGEIRLKDVVRDIAMAAPELRIRLGSLEPTVITEPFCEILSSCPNVCNHFHLSLQSGSDRILKAMNRKYTSREFYDKIKLLRSYFPNCGITADIIMGFPGETNREVEETISFIRQCAFSQTHIFPYSRRPGTPADKMQNQISRNEKQKRTQKARDEAAKTREAFQKKQIGLVLSVLFETKEDGLWCGHSTNYLNVAAAGENLRGQICGVRVTDLQNGILYGELQDCRLHKE